ncbi:MAG: hypothetical protein DDT25_01147 [Chloroflexi bacterium]|nr:hypothetical protein [Chloroflexota bacterium]
MAGAGVRFGDVVVNPATREIRFHGVIRQEAGRVQVLIHLWGYRWLEEKAAIISPAYLTDLQKAIALLDWQLWDHLWHGEAGDQEIEVFLEWGEDKIDANDLIQTRYRLGIGDLVFLGSPLFDPLFLARCLRTAVCVALTDRCPLSLLHERVEAKLVRECGQSGYWLNCERLPAVGTQVAIIIRVPNKERDGSGT